VPTPSRVGRFAQQEHTLLTVGDEWVNRILAEIGRERDAMCPQRLEGGFGICLRLGLAQVMVSGEMM
jgi:hypothetical protein